jgi:hypothetical protein
LRHEYELGLIGYLRVVRLLTTPRSGGETDVERPTFVGVNRTVIVSTPCSAGFQEQIAVAVGADPVVEIALQLGIRFPLTKN